MNRSRIRMVVFDLDGTLVDAYRAVAASVNHAMRELGLPRIDDKRIQRSVGWGEKVLVRSFVPPRLVDDALKIYGPHHRKALLKGTKFLPGAKRTLRNLFRKGYRLAIASNRPSPYTKIILRHLGIAPVFHHVLCADQTARPKPYADILMDLMRRENLRPSELMYVGDMIVDVITGKRARVKTVAVTTGSSTAKELTALRPFRVVPRVSDVVRIIEDWNQE